MDLQILKTELDSDSLGRGYSGLSDLEVADDLNTQYRNRNKEVITGSEAFEQTDDTEYVALTDTKKSQWLSLCGIENHNPFGAAVDAVIDIFGGGSSTVSNLQAFRVETVSRATELGLGSVTVQHVTDARAI